MTDQQPMSSEEVDLAVNEVASHPHAEPLGLMAYDLLRYQVERRNLSITKKFIKQRARAHDVDREKAQTGMGNLMAIYERGPLAHFESALVVAFAIRGFYATWVKLSGAERQKAVKALIACADWLEMCSSYRVYCFIDRLLDDEALTGIYAELAQLIIEQERSQPEGEPAARARNAIRLTALTQAKPGARDQALEHLARSATDAFTRAFLSCGANDFPDADSVRIRGRIAHIPEGFFRMGVRWISGWALIHWLCRLLLKAVGFKREVELELNRESLSIRRRVTLFTRLIKQAEEVVRLSLLEGGTRYVRYPAFHLLIGALSLSFAVLMGGMFLFDGVFAGDSALLLAALVVLLGAGLDLALDTVIPSRAAEVTVEMRIVKGKRLQVSGVPFDDAERFLDRLGKNLEEKGAREVEP